MKSRHYRSEQSRFRKIGKRCLSFESLEHRRLMTGPINTRNRTEVITAYVDRYVPALSTPVTWTGSTAGCVAGSINQQATDATLQMINYFRNMSGLQDVVFDDTFSRKAQEAALMMQAQGALNHSPSTNWACYTADGAQAAWSSNLAFGFTGPRAIAGYVEDFGAGNEFVGHRRWIQNPNVDRMGSGSTSNANALWVFGPFVAQPAPEWVAWPPIGYVTSDLVFPRWSLSRRDADFRNATVTMSLDGRSINVKINPIREGFGLNTLVWEPSNLVLPADVSESRVTISVSNIIVDGTSQNFQYDVIAIPPKSGTLSIEFASPSMTENAGEVPRFITVHRKGVDLSSSLQINLLSNDLRVAAVPLTATFAAGSSSVVVPLTAVDDTVLESNQTVMVSAKANFFGEASRMLTVSDNDGIWPWHNFRDPFNVDNENDVGPVDVLVVINALLRGGTRPLEVPSTVGSETTLFIDVNLDGSLSPTDVLQVINHLRRRGEGESERNIESQNAVDVSLSDSEWLGDTFDNSRQDEWKRTSRLARIAVQ